MFLKYSGEKPRTAVTPLATIQNPNNSKDIKEFEFTNVQFYDSNKSTTEY